jgi:serine/threonine protein kinase
VAHADLVGAVLDGRYKVLERLAEGAMGIVYRAERVKLGRIVAVKVMHDQLPNELSSRQRFEIEAMAMAKLEHPHCAAVLDVGTHEGRPFVVMDYVAGQDLKSLILEGPVPPERAVEIVRQVLSGLAHAHELGIIHRDIKPANIMLSQKAGLGDHVKILDFGLARLQADKGSGLTTGIVVGTPAYMAPEQIRGAKLDGRVDVYACGVLLMELLTGEKPFHSPKDDPIEVVQLHLKKPPPRLADLLPGRDFGELESIVAKALAKNADDRYASATEFAAALEAWSRTVNAVAPEPSAETSTGAAQPISDSMVIPQGGTGPSRMRLLRSCPAT